MISAGLGVYKCERTAHKVVKKVTGKSKKDKEKKKKDKKKKKVPGIPGRLTVRVLEASDLLKADRLGKSDPYAIVDVGKQHHKTSCIKKTLNPKWDEQFQFELDGREKEITVRVFDHDFISMDDSLGKMSTKVKYFHDGNLVDDWWDLSKKGAIHLQIQFHPILEGSLWVNIVEGKDLKSADFLGKSDPYVLAHVGKQHHKTHVKLHTLNPKWNDEMKFSVDDDQKELYLLCRDRDIIGSDDKLGDCHIQLDMFEDGRQIDQWFDFNPKGRVHIQLRFDSKYRNPHTDGYTEHGELEAAVEQMEDLNPPSKVEEPLSRQHVADGVYVPGGQAAPTGLAPSVEYHQGPIASAPIQGYYVPGGHGEVEAPVPAPMKKRRGTEPARRAVAQPLSAAQGVYIPGQQSSGSGPITGLAPPKQEKPKRRSSASSPQPSSEPTVPGIYIPPSTAGKKKKK